MSNQYNIDNDIFLKHLRQAYKEQIIRDYSARGFTISNRLVLKTDYVPELVLESQNEILVFEFKDGRLTKQQKARLRETRSIVPENKHIKINLVVLNAPRSKSILVYDIEAKIAEYLDSQGTADELDILSAHTRFQNVYDIDIDSLEISENYISITGRGIIEVMLQYGSDGDMERGEGAEGPATFPFAFSGRSDFDRTIRELDIKVDTSEFYE